MESIKSKIKVSYLDMLINDAALSGRFLVNPEDRKLVTDHTFIIMYQMVQSSEQVDKHDRNVSNFGLVLCCRHWMGDNGKVISIAQKSQAYQKTNASTMFIVI